MRCYSFENRNNYVRIRLKFHDTIVYLIIGRTPYLVDKYWRLHFYSEIAMTIIIDISGNSFRFYHKLGLENCVIQLNYVCTRKICLIQIFISTPDEIYRPVDRHAFSLMRGDLVTFR